MTRGWVLTLGLSLSFVAVSGAAFMLLAPESLPDKAKQGVVSHALDTGRVMDLEHLTEADFIFLEQVLDDGPPQARISASRALVASGDPRGAPILFSRAGQVGENDLLFCLAAMEILRMQRFETAARTLILAEQNGLSVDCSSEVQQRLAVLSRDRGGVEILAGAPEAQVRRWVSYKLDLDDPSATKVIVALAQDSDLEVRRSAWLAIGAHGKPIRTAELLGWEEQETDPKLRSRIQEVVQSW